MKIIRKRKNNDWPSETRFDKRSVLFPYIWETEEMRVIRLRESDMVHPRCKFKVVELMNGAILNIWLGNIDRVSDSVARLHLYKKKAMKGRISLPAPRPRNRFGNISTLERKEWAAPAQVCQQYFIFSLIQFLQKESLI